MKRFLRIVRNTLLVLALLGLSVYFALQQPAFQTWLTRRITDYLSHELGTKVRVGKVEVDLWARLVLNDVYIEDLEHDTLAFIPKLALRNYNFDKRSGDIIIGHATLYEPFICIRRSERDSLLNIQFLTEYINSFSNPEDSSSSIFSIKNLCLENARVNYINELRPAKEEYGIDWNHLFLSGVTVDLSDLYVAGDTVTAQLHQISALESKGFYIQDFRSDFKMHPGNISLSNADILTNDSEIIGDLSFEFEGMDDFDFFETKVKMLHSLKKTKVQMSDLAYFVSDLKGWNKKLELSGNIRGKVSDLKGRDIEILIDKDTRFVGDFDLDGLPNMDETFIQLDIHELTTTQEDLHRIQLPPFDSLNFLQTPSNFAQLGKIDFSGNFTGFIDDFVAFGRLNTLIGSVETDIAFREDSITKNYFYQGTLKTFSFDLGQYYNDKNLGTLTSDLTLQGKGLTLDKLDVSFEGGVQQVFLNGYNYTNLRADGTFRKKYFEGNFSIYDPNAEMDFSGTIDFSLKKPELDFVADIHHLDLKSINVLTQYDYSSLSGQIAVQSSGLNFANFEGAIQVMDMTYCAKSKDYHIDHLELTAHRTDILTITLESDIATAELKGKMDLPEIVPSFQEILSEVIPSFQPPVRQHREQLFTMEMDILDFTQVSEIFIPELKIAPNTSLVLEVNEPQSFFEIILTGDYVSYGDTKVSNLTIDARRPDSSLYFTITSDQLKIGESLAFDDFAIDARNEKDTVYSAIAWGNSLSQHKGDVNGKLTVRGYQNFDFLMDRSFITVKDQRWDFYKGGTVNIDSTEIVMGQFGIYNGIQKLELNGKISEDPRSSLGVSITAFDLSNVNAFIGGDPNFYGIVSGTAGVRDAYNNLIFTSDLTLLDFKLNEYSVGDLCIETGWENALRRLRVDGELEKGAEKPLAFAGYYRMDDEESPIDIIATIKELDLAFLNEFIGEDVLSLEGLASGSIAITGTPEAPLMEGTAFLKDASIFIDYLNTKYFIEEEVGILPDMFTFDHIRVRDQEGNPGFLTGQILHNVFGDWNFDVIVDMDTPMLAMNTNEELNSLYYGKAYTTGYVSISGFDDQLEFDINLKTAPGTKMAMPMGTSEDLTFDSFIRFVQSDTTEVEQPLDLSGIKLKFDLDITPDAFFEIIFDKAVGDVMSGVGKGHINMEINNLSTFNMYGVVELIQGKYLFTLKNLVNKEFSVRPGGTLTWYGDPFGADMNLKAVYKVSASLADVLPDATNESGQRVPVDLVMNLTGKMFNPLVTFDIELPTVDEVTKSRVQSAISTDQERNRQAFSLLVMRRFVSPPNINREESIGKAFGENGTELLSSQISNWLSQISDDFNLGFNYRPGDEISNDEIALALSTQLFNDRLLVSGNLGVSRGNSLNQNPSNLIGDVRLEYFITPEGKIRLVVYNESNDFRMVTTQQSIYTQGVGILYQEEFNTVDEFFCGFKNLFIKTDKRSDCQ